MVANRRTLRVAGLLLAAAAASVAAASVWSGRAGPAARPLSSERASVVARLGEAAATDAGAVWRERFRAELGWDYAPASLRFFTRAAPDPCAGGRTTTGPFYCAEARALALDLATLDGIKARMRRDGEVAVALFAGRAAVAQAQAALGLGGGPARERAVTGDCLAGVWALRGGLRGASADVYARTLVAADEASRAIAPVVRDAALFAPGAEGARKAAFARGLAAGTIAGCTP